MTQEALGLGWLGWAGSHSGYGPHVLDVFNELGGLQQVACAERCLLALTRTGKVYSMFYSSDTQVGFVYGWLLFLWGGRVCTEIMQELAHISSCCHVFIHVMCFGKQNSFLL